MGACCTELMIRMTLWSYTPLTDSAPSSSTCCFVRRGDGIEPVTSGL
jgi:hypothetical protein